jgi:hypothetical protein
VTAAVTTGAAATLKSWIVFPSRIMASVAYVA